MFKKTLLSLSIILPLFFVGCSNDSSEEASNMVASETFHLVDTNGADYNVTKTGVNFTVQGHEGKVIMFDIFATWCPPCRAEAPNLSHLQKTYSNELLILGVTIEDEIKNSDLEAFKKKYGADYAIVNSKENERLYRAIASATKVGQRFPIPLMVMYKDGQYITHYVGQTPEEMIESDIKKALGK
ncbi:MAG: TlpA disulfide reductase family protein [Helicobacteraceae bacterium]|jgi:thiol-disulfide isomerase/thioredoxin|nr:TlpA disulfide reductase family protein [Helicobacteraceae bacterium]